MPEDPTPSPEPTPQSSDSEPLSSEAEWTDDISAPSSESTVSVPTNQETSEEAWDDEALDWENEPVAVPEPQPQATSTREALAWLKPVWRRGTASWRQVLAGIRTRIPAAAKLSDGVLSGILLGGLVLLLTMFNSVRQPSVAAETPSEQPPVVETELMLEPELSDDATLLDAPPSQPEPSDLELDPAERDRMAELQTQLTTGSLSNGNGLVESVQADFKHNQLTINLTNGWYRLSAYEQEELANTFKQRSTAMTFDDVELRSPNGDLIARSPVVGDSMIILQRDKPPAVEPPPRPRYRITVDR